jgi:hypothetical protein
MNFTTLLNLYLLLHITGFTIMAGGVLADFSIGTRLGKSLSTDKGRALILLEASAGLAPLIAIGGMLLVLTGTGMVIELKSAVTQALWFRIKMPLVLLVVLNGAVMARPNTMRLKKLLLDVPANGDGIRSSGSAVPISAGLSHLRDRRRTIYLFQLLLFITIFVLSIFKF